MSPLELSCVAAAVLAAVFGALWTLTLRLRDLTPIDMLWAAGFVLVAALGFLFGAGDPGRRALALGCVGLWGLRLGGHLFARWRRHGGEDHRYAGLRARAKPGFAVRSLVSVFLPQAAALWALAWPLFWLGGRSGSPGLGALDALGACLFLAGFAIEAAADTQLARFKADPAHQGKVCDRGLWAWSRHPNYFGEAMLWWGVWLMACATPGGWATAFAPLGLTALLVFGTGKPLTERRLAATRPDFAAYRARTSPFILWPPKRGAQSR